MEKNITAALTTFFILSRARQLCGSSCRRALPGFHSVIVHDRPALYKLARKQGRFILQGLETQVDKKKNGVAVVPERHKNGVAVRI